MSARQSEHLQLKCQFSWMYSRRTLRERVICVSVFRQSFCPGVGGGDGQRASGPGLQLMVISSPRWMSRYATISMASVWAENR